MFRPLSALLVAMLLVPAPAVAQDTVPELTKAEKKVYRDYRDDGVIDACEHKVGTLESVLEALAPEADIDTPDLRPVLEAGIAQHESGDCERQAEREAQEQEEQDAAADAGSGTSGTAGSGNSGTGAVAGGTVTPPATDPVDPLPESTNRANRNPPTRSDVTPLPSEPTPAPVAPVAPPAEPTGPAATPEPVYRNGDDALPAALLVLAGLAALIAVLALLYAALSRLGWAEEPLGRTQRAWREAAFRAGGTWGDFSDWIRVGR